MIAGDFIFKLVLIANQLKNEKCKTNVIAAFNVFGICGQFPG